MLVNNAKRSSNFAVPVWPRQTRNSSILRNGAFPLPWGSMDLTWLNLRVKATTFGAELCFSFLFQPQLDSSYKHTQKTHYVQNHTHTVKFESISHFLNGVNIPVGGDTQEEPERKADKALERPNKKKHLRINKWFYQTNPLVSPFPYLTTAL